MRIFLFIFLCYSNSLLSKPEKELSVEEIIKKSHNACQNVKNGYYEMIKTHKSLSKKDTNLSTHICYFQKSDDDSISQSKFHYTLEGDNYKRGFIYNENELIDYNFIDSSGIIFNVYEWSSKIQRLISNYNLYTPLVDSTSFPILNFTTSKDNNEILEKLEDEVFNGIDCYKIKFFKNFELEEDDPFQPLKREIVCWINKTDMIPIQYSVIFEILQIKDTVFQYHKFSLTNYSINTLDNYKFTIDSIPNYITFNDYVPKVRKELLEVKTKAPSWELPNINDEKVKLEIFRGNVVLIDFFYKSCLPCILAIPELQKLHEKYYDKGLRVIGLNPYDDKEKAQIDKFIAKQGITYPVLLNAKDASNDYNVTGYPTFYILDKKGNIIHRGSGYGKGTEKKLEEIILKYLE